jgi:hypothetical protein
MRKAKRAGKPTKTSTPGQDWDGRLQAVYLRRWADSLDGVPPGANFCALDDYMLPIRPAERREIATYLRTLATNPRALQKMIDAAREPERRGRKADTRRVWLALLEFHWRRREAKVEIVATEVAAKWRIGRASLFGAARENVARTTANQTPGGWRFWARFELRRFRATHRGLPPRARRAAFIEYLRSLQ